MRAANEICACMDIAISRIIHAIEEIDTEEWGHILQKLNDLTKTLYTEEAQVQYRRRVKELEKQSKQNANIS